MSIDRQPWQEADSYTTDEGIDPITSSGLAAANVAAKSNPEGPLSPTSVIDTSEVVRRETATTENGMHTTKLYLGRGIERRAGGRDDE